MNTPRPTRIRRLTLALALASGIALAPTAVGAADGFTTPTPPPPPPTRPPVFKAPTAPLPDLTVQAFDATETDGAVDGRLTLSAALAEDLFVTVNPLLLGTNEWDFACPSPGGGGCGWYIDVEIPAGETQADFDLSVIEDDGPEPAEAFGFSATVWDDGLVEVGPPADAVLYDGDGLELAIIDDPEAPEGDPGSDGTLDLVVEANQAVPHPVTFRVRTGVVGGYNGALPGVDYEPVDVVVELPAGDTTLTVEVPLVGDNLDEGPHELLFGYVEDPSHGDIAFNGGSTVARIIDDDAPVVTWKTPGGYQSPSRSARSADLTA